MNREKGAIAKDVGEAEESAVKVGGMLTSGSWNTEAVNFKQIELSHLDGSLLLVWKFVIWMMSKQSSCTTKSVFGNFICNQVLEVDHIKQQSNARVEIMAEIFAV